MRPIPFAVVVNDNPTQLEVLSGLVRKAGLEARAFTGAEAALAEMCATARAGDGHSGALPALIVTDLYMPGLDGWRFCRLLRSPEYASLNHIPIFVVSATFAGEEPDRIAVDLGAEAFFASPVDGRCFAESVQAILKGQRVRSPVRVLIVEDCVAVAASLEQAFEANGYTADTASTAGEAADAFATAVYDVAVLDYHLPDGTGDTLLDAFRVGRPGCVCVMMTADPGPELALDWMKRGAAAYLRKPFQPDYLVELCERARRERALLQVQDLLELRTRELLESEEKHRILLDESPDPIFSLTPEGRYTFANRAFAEGVDKQVQDIVGSSLWDVFPREEADRRYAVLSQACRTGERVEFEGRIPRADSDRYFVTTIVPVTDAGGTVVAAICSARDITERRRAEDALRESEAKFSMAFQTSPYGITITRVEDGEFIEVNDAFTSMTGFTREEALAHSSIGLKLWVDEEDRLRFLSALGAGRALVGQEIQFRTKSGEVITGLFSAQLLNLGQRPCILSSIADITERKRAEEALRESEARLELAYRSAGAGAWDWDMSTQRLVWSRDLYKLFGLDPDGTEATFDTWNQVMHPEDRDGAQQRLERAIHDRLPLVNEYRVVHPDGRVRWMSALGNATLDPSGQPVRMSGICTDITERKQAEEEKVRLEAQLRQVQKMESVGRLAGGVAHDFNNMLGVIIGHAQLAMRRVGPEEPVHASLTEIHKAASRSADLTRQLLGFARRQAVAPRVLDLNETVTGMLRMLERLIGEDISLRWQPGADLWPVRVDPSQIDQVMANLCVNARDAISNIGKVTIETRNCAFNQEYCATHSGFVPGEYVLLAVSDDGCGMDKETLAQLFEPFFTTKEIGKGTGLGLATVYGIVKQNSGFIYVYSEPGSGTTFTIYLPRHVGWAEPVPTEDAVTPAARGQETILLVEDEPAILEMVTAMLEMQGYAMLGAGTPGEAIRLARERVGEIHLLMTDVIMPEMNGRELARNLLSLHPHLKRLFMSGYTSDVIAHHGVLDEGVHFIQKPFSIEDLAARVRETLDSQ